MASFNELLFDSDSDDEYFMGFETEEINNNDNTYNIDGDIELSDDELRGIREEIEKEERDPAFDAYDDKWLMRFTEIVGPIHVHDPVPYAIFEQLFDIDIVDMLVDETNRYYDQQMTKQGGVDSLPTHSRFRKICKREPRRDESIHCYSIVYGTSKAAQLQVILEYTSPVVFEYSFYHAQGQVYEHNDIFSCM